MAIQCVVMNFSDVVLDVDITSPLVSSGYNPHIVLLHTKRDVDSLCGLGPGQGDDDPVRGDELLGRFAICECNLDSLGFRCSLMNPCYYRIL